MRCEGAVSLSGKKLLLYALVSAESPYLFGIATSDSLVRASENNHSPFITCLPLREVEKPRPEKDELVPGSINFILPVPGRIKSRAKSHSKEPLCSLHETKEI